MKTPWGNLYDRAKDRRYGVLFFYVLLAIIGALLVASRLPKESRINSS